MSQEDIIDYLKANPTSWFTAKELAAILNLTRSSAQASLNTLVNYFSPKIIKRERIGKWTSFEYRLRRVKR